MLNSQQNRGAWQLADLSAVEAAPAQWRRPAAVEGNTHFRESIQLPDKNAGLRPTAKRVAAQMRADWLLARELVGTIRQYKREGFERFRARQETIPVTVREMVAAEIKGETRGIGIRKAEPGATMEGFRWAYEAALRSLGLGFIAKVNPALLQVVAFHTMRRAGNDLGFIKDKPMGLFHSDRGDWLTTALPFVHEVMSEQLGVKTAADIEGHGALSSSLKAAGLQQVLRELPIEELIERLWPGITQGVVPAVRPYVVSGRDKLAKATLSDAAARMLAEVVLERGRPVMADGLEPRFDRQTVRRVAWLDAWNDGGAGSMISDHPLLGDCRNAFFWGAAKLGHIGVFGVGPNKLLPTDILTQGMWKGAQVEGFVECATIEFMEFYLREKHPEFYADAGQGAPIPEKLKNFRQWGISIVECVGQVLREAGMSIEEALRQIYPELFGVAPHRLRSEHFCFEEKWKGRDANRDFLAALTYALLDQPLGRFVIEPPTSGGRARGFYAISPQDVVTFYRQRASKETDSVWLERVVRSSGLSSGMQQLYGGGYRKLRLSFFESLAPGVSFDSPVGSHRWLASMVDQGCAALGTAELRFELGSLSQREVDEIQGRETPYAPRALSELRKSTIWLPPPLSPSAEDKQS